MLSFVKQRRRKIHPGMYRAGETPPDYELHIYRPVPVHCAHHRTTGYYTLCLVLSK